MFPPGRSPATEQESTWNTSRKGGGRYRLHRATAHTRALHHRSSLRERKRAEVCPVEEVFPGLTSWVLLGQLCGSCLDNSKALSRLSVTNHPSLASCGSLMPGKQCFQAPPRPASIEYILIPGVGWNWGVRPLRVPSAS